ncbi:glycosyltransferase family 2 protein [Pontibacter sp. MBLB2868]|uniref:glycosyltransferase family 2 protein n=1 Tax=Pontibacter sp. MBLB2868 TaxID=3451555 RepID=UPI003F74F646
MGNLISVTVLTKNSQKLLSTCLSALQDFDEVIVLDNGSTDNTIAIAKQFQNVKVIETPFIGFGPLKNFAAQSAANNWILSIDSDEVLADDLKAELLNLELSDTTVYSFKRHNYYRNKHIRACGWDNDVVLRLYNKCSTSFANLQVHEYVRTEGLEVQQIAGTLHHYSYDSIAQLISKSNSYTSLFASENRFLKKSSPFKSYYKWVFSFFKNYVLQRGFLYGYEGFTISFTNAAGAFYKYMKLYEANQTLQISLIILQPQNREVWETTRQKLCLQQEAPVELITMHTDPEVSTSGLVQVQHTFMPVRYVNSSGTFNFHAILREAVEISVGEYVVVVANNAVLTTDFLKQVKRQAKRGTFIYKSSGAPTSLSSFIAFWKNDFALLSASKQPPTEATEGFDSLAAELQLHGIKMWADF